MQKMTDEQIIKALECCGIHETNCISCPYFEKTYCVDADALKLINRQKAEVERLQKANESFSCLGKLYSEIKSEAKKEVADSLQSILDEHTLQNGDVHFVALYKAVEKLTKELTE